MCHNLDDEWVRGVTISSSSTTGGVRCLCRAAYLQEQFAAPASNRSSCDAHRRCSCRPRCMTHVFARSPGRVGSRFRFRPTACVHSCNYKIIKKCLDTKYILCFFKIYHAISISYNIKN